MAHRRIPVLALVAVLLVSTSAPSAGAAPATTHDPARHLAKDQLRRSLTAPRPTRPGAGASRLPRAATARRNVVLIAHVSDRSQVATVVAAARHGDLGVRHTLTRLRAVSIRVAPEQVGSALARLRAVPGVTDVERAVQRRLSDVGATPDDPRYARQASYLSSVGAPLAWALQTGSPAVRIAVLDSGVDIHHPDLTGKIVFPRNVVAASADVSDEVGHGTFVAGVAAAHTDNGVGIAGAGWRTKIMPVKIADPDGFISVDDEAAGITWAVTHGAAIINLSLGGYNPSPTESAAITYAQSQGVLVVAAAGNESTSVRAYPAGLAGVIAVGATDANGHRASFSNHGSWVTVAAPGTDIYSTAPTAGSQMFPTTSGYSSAAGTSFAAPIVAGLAALLEAAHPHLGPAALRRELIVSAHGYRQTGLGAGQVDFLQALSHVPPTSRPAAPRQSSSAGVLTLSTASSAPTVRFRIDAESWSAPITVSGGHASLRFSSYGYANGAHTVTAIDCSAHAECNAAPSAAPLRLANPAPVITSPAPRAALSGPFVVTAASRGGGLGFRIDGARLAFVHAAPYTAHFSGSALSDGTHTLRVRQCSADHLHCAGPFSRPVTVTTDSLHPTIAGFDPPLFSPNADRRKDGTLLTFTLPDRENVTIRVRAANGSLVRGPVSIGSLGAGVHTWSWRGHRPASTDFVADGTYTAELSTSAGGLLGSVSRAVRVDTAGAAFTSVVGRGVHFDPLRDGYRDHFVPSALLSEPATVTLTIRDAGGHLVQTRSGYRHAGRATIEWWGRDRSGKLITPGVYTWTFSAVDRAGNPSSTSVFHVYASVAKLVKRTIVLGAAGSSFYAAGANDASCGDATTQFTNYSHGVYLIQTCDPRTKGAQRSVARYRFTLPPARRYATLSIQARGSAFYVPSELSGAYYRTDRSAVAIPQYRTLGSLAERTYALGTIAAPGYVGAHRVARIGVAVDNRYVATSPFGTSDFDIASVRLTVTYFVLQ